LKISLADADVCKQLLADYNLEIGVGLGDLAGKVWRIGCCSASVHWMLCWVE